MAPGNEGRAPRLPLGGSCQPNRLTEGESLGILDAAPNEALVVDQRSLLQSASRPAPSQREPLACTTRFGLPFIKPAKLQFGENICPANVGEDIILPRSGAFQSCTLSGEFVQTWTITHSTKHAVIPRGARLIASPTGDCTVFECIQTFLP